jgi:intraflagellar transport protein 140
MSVLTSYHHLDTHSHPHRYTPPHTYQVWENMARLCVRARNLDAAELCLGKMGHARGLRAVRQARSEQGQEEEEEGHGVDGSSKALVPLAMVAIQLGMLDAAARLYDEAKRPDLLLRLLVAQGKWTEALALADGGADPLWRRRTHFEYAVHLEALGQWEAAARHYELVRTVYGR